MNRVPGPTRFITAPRRGASSCLRSGWSFGGVFLLSAGSPMRPSGEGVGMT